MRPRRLPPRAGHPAACTARECPPRPEWSRCRMRGRAPSVWKNAGRQIAIAAVADDADDDSVLQLLRDAQCDMHRAAGRDAGEDAFLAREAPRHLLGLGLAHRFDAIDALLVVDLRQVGLGPLAEARDLRAFLRLAADDLDLCVLLLEAARAPHDGAGRDPA